MSLSVWIGHNITQRFFLFYRILDAVSSYLLLFFVEKLKKV